MQLSKRNFLKGAAGIATIGTVGLGATALSGSATATAGSTIDDPSAVTSDDGEISYVAVQATGRVEWDGFDTPAKQARIINRVTFKRNGSELGSWEIHDTGKFDLTQSDWGGSGEEISLTGDHAAGQRGYIASDVDWGIAQANRENTYNNGYGLPQNPAPVSDLFAATDGGSTDTKVVLEATYLLYDSNGSELTGQSGYPDRIKTSSSFVVTVNNEQSTTSTGDADAEGDTDDGATVGV